MKKRSFKNSYNIKLLSIIIIILSLLPAALLYSIKSEDAYWFLVFIPCEYYKLQGNIDITSNNPGQNAFVIILSLLTNVQISAIQFWPVSGILIPFMAYTLVLKLTKHIFASALFACYIGFNFVNGIHSYSVASNGLAILLFFTYLLLINDIFNEKRNVQRLILLISLFIAIHFTYYSIELWALSLILYINMIIYIGRRHFNFFVSSPGTIYLSLCFLVIFFGFNQAVYKGFASRLRASDTLEFSISWTYDKLFQFLGGTKSAFIGEYDYVPYTPLKDYLTLFQICFLSALFFILLIFILHSNNRNNKVGSVNLYLAISLLGVTCSEIFVYFLRGLLNLRSFFYLMPIAIILLICIVEKKSSKLLIFSVFSLCLIVVMSFTVSYFMDSLSCSSPYDTMRPSAYWFDHHASADSIILTDLHTIFKFRSINALSTTNYYSFLFYDNLNYGHLVNRTLNSNLSDYLIIDFGALDKPIVSTTPKSDWKTFRPLSFYYKNISHNCFINKIYNDATAEIFQVK